MMDPLDVLVVRELAQGGPEVFHLRPGSGPSLRAMSRKLKVSEGTVRNRVAKLRASGFLGKARVIPNPALLGLDQAAYFGSVAPARSKKLVVDQLCAIDGLFLVTNYYGSRVGIVFFYEAGSSPNERINLFDKLTGDASGTVVRIPYPPCATMPTATDWRLISYLSRHGPRTHEELSRTLKLSVRTVKRRLSTLTRSGAIFSFPHFNLRAVEGGVPASLLVRYSEHADQAKAESKVLEVVHDFFFYVGRWDGAHHLALMLPNPATAMKVAHTVGQLDCVDWATVDIIVDSIDEVEVLGDYVARRLERGLRPPPEGLARGGPSLEGPFGSSRLIRQPGGGRMPRSRPIPPRGRGPSEAPPPRAE